MSKKLTCKKCGSKHIVKAGKVRDNQRYKCTSCGYQFQPNRSKGKADSTKKIAVFLYQCGLSMRTIAKIVKTDVHAVYRWIRKFTEENYKKPKQKPEVVIVELDEIWHFIKDMKTYSGFGRLIIAIPVNLSTGSAEGEIMLHLQNFASA
jgi:transposase-like protein